MAAAERVWTRRDEDEEAPDGRRPHRRRRRRRGGQEQAGAEAVPKEASEEEEANAGAEVEVELEGPGGPEDQPRGPEADWDEPEAPVWSWSPSSAERHLRPPPQRRRKSEYPRRRTCIAFTYSGAESRETLGERQTLETSQAEPLQDLPAYPSSQKDPGLPRPALGRWRGPGSGPDPSAQEEETRWEPSHWGESFPPDTPCPAARGQESSPDPRTVELVCEMECPRPPEEGCFSLSGLAAVSALPNSNRDPDLENSDAESDDDGVPFRDDPKDKMYDPSTNRDRGKLKRKPRKVKVKVEPPDPLESPTRTIQQAKEDRGPRPPKKRKKPPIQYVRCEIEGCGTILANPRYLQHHMRYQHLTKKKYVCPHPTCGRLFRLQKQLLRHTKHHSDQRDYICEYCARAFKSSHNLAVHRMIHTGEKPLQCEICGFTCRQKASLNWHMKKHDAESGYQFPCDVCGKRFEKKDSVVAHKSKSHPETLIAEALADSMGGLQP